MEFIPAKDLNAVAIYAAILSTFVFFWQVYVHFREGPRLQVRANPDMKYLEGRQFSKETYIVVNVSNRGSADTTITHVVAFSYDNWWRRLRDRPSLTFIVNHSSVAYPIPYVLEVGRMFTSMASQTVQLEELSRTTLLYIGVYHSFSEGPALFRLKPIKPAKQGDETPPEKTLPKS